MQMARVSYTNFAMMIALAAMLAISASAQTTCKNIDEFCGGIAGFQCCEGLQCILQGDFPDAGGNCKPTTTETCRKSGDFCGGIAAFQCCQGLNCILDGDYPDAGGVCRKQRPCQKGGKFCGGFTGVQCCKGFECVIDNVEFPDAGGKCKRSHC